MPMPRPAAACIERTDDGDTAKRIGEKQDDTPDTDRALVETLEEAQEPDARDASRHKE
jgi:hypothetical protein